MRVVLTHPSRRPDELKAALRAAKIQLVHLPQLKITSLKPKLLQTKPDWLVLLSQSAVRATSLSLKKLQTTKIATVGAATRSLVRELGIAVAFTPQTFTALELAKTLPIKKGETVWLYSGGQTDERFFRQLRKRGVVVREFKVYTAKPISYPVSRLKKVFTKPVDAIGLTSAAGVAVLAQNLKKLKLTKLPPVVCLGSVAASAARRAGFRQITVAERANFAAFATCFTKQPQ